MDRHDKRVIFLCRMSGQRKSLLKRKVKSNILPGEPPDQSEESTNRVGETINVDGVDNMGNSNNDMFTPTLRGRPKMSTFSQMYKPYARGEGVTADVRI